MAITRQFLLTDEETDNKLTVYINAKKRVYLAVGSDLNELNESHFVTMNREDLWYLIKELKSLLKKTPNG